MRNNGIRARQVLIWGLVAVFAAWAFGFEAGRAAEREETVLTVLVSSAEHELIEGYFSLGSDATIVAKPGSDLYKFLARQRGRKVKITLTETGGPALHQLERQP